MPRADAHRSADSLKTHFLKRLSRQLRGRWRARSLSAHGIAILAQTKNGLLAVHAGDFNVSRSLLVDGEYDGPQIAWISDLAQSSSRLIFAGAHIGAVLIPMVLASGARGVLAFEPSPRNFKLLTANLRLNCLRQVVAINAALGETPGSIHFTENSINTGNSRIAADTGEIQVALQALDAAVPHDWDRVDLIVMDIEGSEVAAMRGARATLAKTSNLYIEFAPEQLREQGSGAAQFVEIVQQFFKSAYVFGTPIRFLGSEEFPQYLRELEDRHGLLLNLLFTQDTQPNPKRLLLRGEAAAL